MLRITESLFFMELQTLSVDSEPSADPVSKLLFVCGCVVHFVLLKWFYLFLFNVYSSPIVSDIYGVENTVFCLRLFS